MRFAADTNVYIYLHDDRDVEKQATAQHLLRCMFAGNAAVSLQVVGEVQNVLLRKLKFPVHVAQQEARNVFVSLPSFAYDAACVERALAQAAAGRLAYWDALLLAACDRARIAVLFSEDMQDGYRMGGVEVVNPFGTAGLSERAREHLGF